MSSLDLFEPLFGEFEHSIVDRLWKLVAIRRDLMGIVSLGEWVRLFRLAQRLGGDGVREFGLWLLRGVRHNLLFLFRHFICCVFFRLVNWEGYFVTSV